VNDRLLRAVADEHRDVLKESLVALYDAATEAFQQPDATAPAAAGAARLAET
jgi:hypothetical protein